VNQNHTNLNFLHRRGELKIATMWFVYLCIAGVFVFLSQLSGLPQAMFYHLHWAVALPMAFLGFLVLLPGLIREIFKFVIWPLFRPFVQLLVEAVGFVNITSEDDTQATGPYSAPAPIQTILTLLRLSSKSKLPNDSLTNSPTPFAHHLSPTDCLRRSPRQSPRASPLQSRRLSSLRTSAHSTPHSSPTRSPHRSPHRSPNRSPYHSPHRSPVRSPQRSPLHSRQNSPAAVERSRLTTNASDGNRPKSADKRTKSPLGSNTSSASRRDDAYANKWHQARTERSQYSSTDTEDEDFQKAVQKIQDLRRKKLEEQYEVAIRTLTPVIREHVKKIKSASPEKDSKKTAAAAEGTTSTQISKRKKANSESEKKSSLDHAFDVT